MLHLADLRAGLAVPSPKSHRGGTCRTVSPEETLHRVAAVAEAAGITRVGAIGGLDRIGLPVYCAYRPMSRNLAVSQGKGLTAAIATASATMEAIELWHAERHRIPFRYASHEELRAAGEAVVDVDGVVKCPCNEFTPDRRLRWTRGLDLIGDEPMWVPYESVHCDWRTPTAAGDHAFQNGSNGLASGNTHAEAVVHALCEVMERDAIVRFDRLAPADSVRRRVRPDSVDDPDCLAAMELFRAAGVDLVIWDMTSPLGLPTYSCVAVETDAPWYQPLPQTQGSGAHPLRGLALLRAVTETAQARAAIIAGSRDDVFDERYQHYFDHEARREIAAETAIPATRSFTATAEAYHDTANEDLAWLLRRLAEAGHRQVVVVDLTDPEWEVPVVKVIVPGLEWRPWEE